MHRRVHSDGVVDPNLPLFHALFSKPEDWDEEQDLEKAEPRDEDQDLIETAQTECSQVGWRVRQELYLFQQQWWKLVVLWGVVVRGVSTRNERRVLSL